MEEDREKGKPKTKTKPAVLTTRVHLNERKYTCWPPFCIKRASNGQAGGTILQVVGARDGDSGNNGENRGRNFGLTAAKKPIGTGGGAPLISIQLSGVGESGNLDQVEPCSTEVVEEAGPTLAPGAATATEQLALAAANVDSVRRNFIALIRYNKLQYFYLGTLIYSVMNIGFIFYIIRSIEVSQQSVELIQQIKITYTNESGPTSGGGGGGSNGGNRAQVAVNPVEGFGCNSSNRQLVSEIYLRLVIILIPLASLLTLVAVCRALLFDKHMPEETCPDRTGPGPREGALQTTSKTSLKRKLANLVQSSGFILAILLLCLPILLLNLADSTIGRRNVSSAADNNLTSSSADNLCRSHQPTEQAGFGWLPMDWLAGGEPVAATSAILALIYLQPLLLEGSSICAKLAGVLAILPALVSVLLRFLWLRRQLRPGLSPEATTTPIGGSNQTDTTGRLKVESHDDALNGSQRLLEADFDLFSVLIGCLPLVFLLGMLKRQRYVQVIARKTFAGASQLIEAKVSLEHQRQQQETLLLSVLPAYVAEQVKRNMLKKTTTATIHSAEQEQPHTNWPVQQSSSRSFATLTGGLFGNPQQLETVDEAPQAAGANELKIVDLETMKQSNLSPELQQQVVAGGRSTSVASATSLRNSFLLSTRFTTSLVSGASLMSGTLSAAGKGIHQQPSLSSRQQLSTSPHHHVPLSAQVSANTSTARRGFNELYIRTYNNVSLLYGDIVGFTCLCTQLSSSQLVRVLNDLFSHFDHLAEKHKIMRIKILGDCYYGVSGIPEFAVMGAKSRASRNDNHAINCVNMGLDMIHYIRCLNVERASNGSSALQKAVPHSVSATETPVSENCASASTSGDRFSSASTAGGKMHSAGHKSAGNSTPMPIFELNMRIGVHTGHIHSGVIGLKKWQFDVWSNDVSIAMHCESSGVPGRVQVTEATVLQLNGAFTYENVPGNTQDSFLADKEICTYLICDRVKQEQNSTRNTLKAEQHQLSIATPINKKQQIAAKRKKQSVVQTNFEAGDMERIDREAAASLACSKQQYIDCSMDEDNIRAATIGTIRQTLLAGESANSSDALGCYGLIYNHHDIRPYLLNYRDSAMDRLYANRPIEGWLQELFTLILLLAVILPLINLQFQRANQFYGNEPSSSNGDSGAQMKFIMVATLIATLLLLVNFWPHLCCRIKRHNSHRDDLYNQMRNLVPSTESRGQESKSHQVIYDRDRCGKKQTSCPVNASRSAMMNSYQSASEFLEHAIKRLRPIGGHRRQGLRTGLALILFASVILFQAYMIIVSYQRYLNDRSCVSTENKRITNNNAQKDDNNWLKSQHLLGEQYQLTVILLLISIDSSANILSYRTRSILIMCIIGLQIILTWQPGLIEQMARWSGIADNCNNVDNATERPIEMGSSSSTSQINQQVLYWSSNALLIVMALWSLAFARQLEYTSRTNFLWRNRLNVDHEELEYISGINKVLLENILPSHVVQHYLTHPNGQLNNVDQLPNLQAYMRMSFSNMRSINNELYHEQHDSVAVMFASIPHFYEFYDESDISKQGLGCIALLNEIICDFDKLLLKNKFSRIEKIKTIGSTYMAAAGLRPSHLSSSRNSNASQLNAPISTMSSQSSFSFKNRGLQTGGGASVPETTSNSPINYVSLNTDFDDHRRLVMSQQKLNLICMVQFATSLMTALNGINKQSFQVFKLRVGLNAGPVIAGVIGAQRPFYDIWGDCVNIASRMESLGEVGRIQVEERTAKLLQESLCIESYSIVRRGPIDVKGKGGMVTYFVDKKANSLSAGIGDNVPVEHQQYQQQQQQRQRKTSETGGQQERPSQQVASSASNAG